MLLIIKPPDNLGEGNVTARYTIARRAGLGREPWVTLISPPFGVSFIYIRRLALLPAASSEVSAPEIL